MKVLDQIRANLKQYIQYAEPVTFEGSSKYIAKAIFDGYLEAIRYEDIPVFEITNCYDYILSLADEDGQLGKTLGQMIPNAAPPFSLCWFEYTKPDGKRISWFMKVADASPGGEEKWLLAFTMLSANDHQVSYPYMAAIVGVKEDGSMAEEIKGIPLAFDREGLSSEELDDWLENEMGQLVVPLLAIAFTHCKNVEVVEGRSPRYQRRQAAREGVSLTKFYTLEIGRITKVLRDAGATNASGLKKALHICRGHFATYTEERPLFGKYVGTFWVPSHTRGSLEAGKIQKDYMVKVREGEL